MATLVVLLGGIAQGSFLLPMRFARRWAWENIWLVYSLVGLLLVPSIAAQATVPHLVLVYRSVPAHALLVTGLFGFGWGVANVLLGLAVPMIGMALSFAIVVGMSAALGSLIPLVFSTPERLVQPSGLLVLSGVALTTLGVILLGWAGRAREKSVVDRGLSSHGSLAKITLGLVLCVLSGLMAPMLNFSFAFGSQIRAQAVHQGASPTQAVNAIWAVALAGGGISNGGYATILLSRAKTWKKFGQDKSLSHYALSVFMGLLFTGGLFLYGWGASALGDLGPVVGWPVFQATMLILSSAVGIALGEWRGAEPRIFRANEIGLMILVMAIVVLSFGNRI